MQIWARIKNAYKNRLSNLTTEQYADHVKDINAAYARLFSTDDGKYVLDHMVQHNLAVPIAQKGFDLLDIGEKQGRANLVNEILQRMEKDRNGI